MIEVIYTIHGIEAISCAEGRYIRNPKTHPALELHARRVESTKIPVSADRQRGVFLLETPRYFDVAHTEPNLDTFGVAVVAGKRVCVRDQFGVCATGGSAEPPLQRKRLGQH